MTTPPSGAPAGLPVEDASAARFLLDEEGSRFLVPFFGEPASVGEAARALGVEPALMFRRVKRMERLGLVEVAGHRPRRGRPTKLYRARARRFFVPFRYAPYPSLEAFVDEVNRRWYPAFLRGLARAWEDDLADDWGFSVFPDAGGELVVYLVDDPATAPEVVPDRYRARAALNVWEERLWLSAEDALQMQRELFEVVYRYRERRSGGRHLLRLGVAPLPPD